MSRNEAIDALIGKSHNQYRPPPPSQKPVLEKKPLVMPEKNGNYKRLFAYLTKSRGIDAATVQDLIDRGKLYESKDTHNCVFVSHDESGNPAYVYQRGTLSEGKPFKRDSGNKDCAFAITGNSSRLYVYEGSIDAISDITLSKLI